MKKLNKVSKSETSQTKVRIQKLLREIAIKRDGGCVLRHYEEAGECGGFKNDGDLILQAEHLHTRDRNISFADMRNIVCLCMRHHFYFKKQYGALYWDLIRRHIGEKRWEWLQRVIKDNRSYPMGKSDWKLLEIALIEELK